jgi:hypothetical protein
MKPQLANEANLATLTYPVGVQVKIDGVRALNINGTLTGRSLDPFKGFGITEFWSLPQLVGLDGEMTLGDNPASTDRLCSLTTGAMGAFKGVTEVAKLHRWLFDDLTNPADPYKVRYERLKQRVQALNMPQVHLVPLHIANNREELDALIARINLYKKYPESLKLVHLLPMVFTVGVIGTLLLLFFGFLPYMLGTVHVFPTLGNAMAALGCIGLAGIILYTIALFIDSSRENHSVKIGLLSIRAAFTQLMGYGCGFLSAWWKRCVLGQSEFSAYNKTFYK